jgi:hypothetical protein
MEVLKGWNVVVVVIQGRRVARAMLWKMIKKATATAVLLTKEQQEKSRHRTLTTATAVATTATIQACHIIKV